MRLPTYEMDQAERELNARAEYAMGKARVVEQSTEELEERTGPPEPPTDEDVERIRAYVLGHARTEEWNRVIERITRGELTWREITESLTSGHADRGVTAAFNSLSRVPPASVEELIASGVLPADQPDETPPAEPEPEQPVARRRRPVEEEDEESFFDNPLKHRPR